MILFLAQRIAGFAATLLVAAAAIFLLLDWLPGDPARFTLGINAPAEAVAALRAQLGLDLPLPRRLWNWLAGLMQGDLGTSYTQGAPIASLIAERLQVTLPLALAAMVISMLVGLPLGVLAAQRRGSPSDVGLMVLAQIGIAVPSFWFGMVLALIFAVWLRWLPAGGFVPFTEDFPGAVRALILPSVALALPQAAILARVMRTSLVDVANMDFIRTAEAKGMTHAQALRRHGVRNALLPVLTILGLQFAFLIAGTIIVEEVFFLPGLGDLIFTAISERDLVLVRGASLVLVGATTVAMLFTDLSLRIADPRLRTPGR